VPFAEAHRVAILGHQHTARRSDGQRIARTLCASARPGGVFTHVPSPLTDHLPAAESAERTNLWHLSSAPRSYDSCRRRPGKSRFPHISAGERREAAAPRRRAAAGVGELQVLLERLSDAQASTRIWALIARRPTEDRELLDVDQCRSLPLPAPGDQESLALSNASPRHIGAIGLKTLMPVTER
jgi:hypothetical protein